MLDISLGARTACYTPKSLMLFRLLVNQTFTEKEDIRPSDYYIPLTQTTHKCHHEKDYTYDGDYKYEANSPSQLISDRQPQVHRSANGVSVSETCTIAAF